MNSYTIVTLEKKRKKWVVHETVNARATDTQFRTSTDKKQNPKFGTVISLKLYFNVSFALFAFLLFAIFFMEQYRSYHTYGLPTTTTTRERSRRNLSSPSSSLLSSDRKVSNLYLKKANEKRNKRSFDFEARETNNNKYNNNNNHV